MRVFTETVTVAVDASGDATSYTTGYINGIVKSVEYTKTDYANGVDFTITGETSGINVWTESDVNAAKTISPQQATHSTAGVASLYAAAGTAVETDVYLADERIKIVVASGGVSKTGAFTIVWSTL